MGGWFSTMGGRNVTRKSISRFWNRRQKMKDKRIWDERHELLRRESQTGANAVISAARNVTAELNEDVTNEELDQIQEAKTRAAKAGISRMEAEIAERQAKLEEYQICLERAEAMTPKAERIVGEKAVKAVEAGVNKGLTEEQAVDLSRKISGKRAAKDEAAKLCG